MSVFLDPENEGPSEIAYDDDGGSGFGDSKITLTNLDPGTYYVWRQKAGYNFADPDTEVVS